MSDLLDNEEVIKWCYQGITDVSLMNTDNLEVLQKAKEIEKEWGNRMIDQKNNKQWTTKLCESIVKEALIRMGRKNVRKATPMEGSQRHKKYIPDLECDEFVYEVKGRNWCTPGTAGEKILGVPLKYGELPRLYKKPLQIILVGYQEYEAKKKFAFGDLLNKEDQTEELSESLAFYEEHQIEYIAFTDILNNLSKKGLLNNSQS